MRRFTSIAQPGAQIATGSGTAGQLACFSNGQLVDAVMQDSLAVFQVSGIDAKTLATTLIGTTANNGKRFYPFHVVIDCTAANTVSVVGALSVGSNSASFNDIIAISTLTGLSGANLFLHVPLTLIATSVAPNTGISVKVTTGAIATSQTMRVTVMGVYI